MDKETKNFLKPFTTKSAEISPAFKKKLEKKILNEYKWGSFWNIFTPLALSVFLIIFIFVFVQNGYNSNNKADISQKYAVSAEREKEILIKLENANLIPLLEQSITENDTSILTHISLNNLNSSVPIDQSTIIIPSYPVSYASDPILVAKETITKGDKYNSCNALVERFENANEIETKYYKENGKIIKVEEKKKSNESENVLESDIPSYPISFPSSYPILEENTFINVLEEEVKDNTRYFILRMEKKIEGCENNIVFIAKVQESDLNIVQLESYEESVNENNLIFKSELSS